MSAREGSICADADFLFDIWEALPEATLFECNVGSGSMCPVLQPGDVILVERCSGMHIEAGDIVLFRRILGPRYRLVAHRCMGTDGTALLTGTDRSLYPRAVEPPVPFRHVLGRCVGIKHGTGYVSLRRSRHPLHRWILRTCARARPARLGRAAHRLARLVVFGRLSMQQGSTRGRRQEVVTVSARADAPRQAGQGGTTQAADR